MVMGLMVGLLWRLWTTCYDGFSALPVWPEIQGLGHLDACVPVDSVVGFDAAVGDGVAVGVHIGGIEFVVDFGLLLLWSRG